MAVAVKYVARALTNLNQYYKEINPSTLTGAIDIVVVKHADGLTICSPFHVRFGKLRILRPQDKVIDLYLDDQKIQYQMKLGDAGEAFFVVETDDRVPQEEATSPILAAGSTSGGEEEEEGDIEPLELGNSHRPPSPTAVSTTSLEDDEEEEEEEEEGEDVLDGTTPVESPMSIGQVTTLKKKKSKYYRKALRLSSEQLNSLQLTPSKSYTIKFKAASSKAECSARLFVWSDSDKIVISDIDGTITKSDALGHIFTMVGKDWTHRGVAKLYTDIFNNGYKILYLTSRAIGQADSTRGYLKGVQQGLFQLPEGPVIMSPDRLFTSFHREVIIRQPHLFKMSCLKDLQKLFGEGATPFYAGFGNRITDALSYRHVKVPASRIFTIDTNGDVRRELLVGFTSSYVSLNDLVHEIFPGTVDIATSEFSDYNYWKPTLPSIIPARPVSPASSDSRRSPLSFLSSFAGMSPKSADTVLMYEESDDDDRQVEFEEGGEEEEGRGEEDKPSDDFYDELSIDLSEYPY